MTAFSPEMPRPPQFLIKSRRHVRKSLPLVPRISMRSGFLKKSHVMEIMIKLWSCSFFYIMFFKIAQLFWHLALPWSSRQLIAAVLLKALRVIEYDKQMQQAALRVIFVMILLSPPCSIFVEKKRKRLSMHNHGCAALTIATWGDDRRLCFNW